MTWEQQAACNPSVRGDWGDADATEVFFEAGEDVWGPVCASCHVRAQCLVAGILVSEGGVWGGVSEATIPLLRRRIASGQTTLSEILRERDLRLSADEVTALAVRSWDLVVDPETLQVLADTDPLVEIVEEPAPLTEVQMSFF